MKMPPDVGNAPQVKLLMKAVAHQVYCCAIVCLALGAPVVYLASTLESQWASISILGLLVIAPMVNGYLCLKRMTIRARGSM